MKQYILTFLILVTALFLTAQDFDNYQPLKSSGSIPAIFTTKTSEKATNEIKANANTSDNYEEKKNKAIVILNSNNILDRLLISGCVLFGDSVSEYLSTIADKLLIDEPGLRKKLRFYTIKSNLPNSFCSSQGMIFVTLGLIAQLENEAQLAQILANQIAHYTKKHAPYSMLAPNRFSQNKGYNKYNNQDYYISKLSNYSKNSELEADSLGCLRLKDIGYSAREALNLFDVLEFSYLPFNEQPFSYSYFETGKIKIPKSYRLDTVTLVKFEEDNYYNDRRKQIVNLILNKIGGKKYLTSRKLFEKIRLISRFESVRISNQNTSYVKGFYNAQVLLKTHPNSTFLIKNMLKSLYGITKCKLRNKYLEHYDGYEDYEGEISAVYYFFEKLSTIQLTSLTLEKLNEYYLSKKNKQIEQLLSNLIEDLVIHENIEFKDYYEIKAIDTSSIIDSIKTLEKGLDNKSISKYSRLRTIKKKQELLKKINQSPLEKEKIFHHEYLYSSSNRKQLEAWFNNVKEEPKQIEKDKNVYKSAGMQTDKIVFFAPEYFMYDKLGNPKFDDAEIQQLKLITQLSKNAEKANLDYSILSIKQFKTNEVEKYNDLAAINNLLNEKINLQNLNHSFIPTETEYIEGLHTKYGTNIFIYTGVLQQRSFEINSYIYTLVFDLNQTSTYIEDNLSFTYKISKEDINSQLYKTLTQLKK